MIKVEPACRRQGHPELNAQRKSAVSENKMYWLALIANYSHCNDGKRLTTANSQPTPANSNYIIIFSTCPFSSDLPEMRLSALSLSIVRPG